MIMMVKEYLAGKAALKRQLEMSEREMVLKRLYTTLMDKYLDLHTTYNRLVHSNHELRIQHNLRCKEILDLKLKQGAHQCQVEKRPTTSTTCETTTNSMKL